MEVLLGMECCSVRMSGETSGNMHSDNARKIFTVSPCKDEKGIVGY